jgi:hypothetical protein
MLNSRISADWVWLSPTQNGLKLINDAANLVEGSKPQDLEFGELVHYGHH